MFFSRGPLAAALLSLAPILQIGVAWAADLPAEAVKKVVPDIPFFSVIDDRVSFSWMPKGTDPGVFSIRPDGSVNGKTAMSVYSFTHFDIWAYGTNFFTISMYKSDKNDPANPCTSPGAVFDPGTGIDSPFCPPSSCARQSLLMAAQSASDNSEGSTTSKGSSAISALRATR
jgi:hypothetical protein